jgi:hypothetical protein
MLDIAQAHHPVSEQLQRPALSPIRGLATGQMNQLGLALAIQASAFGTFSGEAADESHLQVLLHKSLFDTYHRAATHIQRLGNLSIGCLWFTLALIAHQQHAGHQIVLGWSTTHVDHRLQPSTLLLAQSHGIAVVISTHLFPSFSRLFFLPFACFSRPLGVAIPS